jgi:hypothetical protein
MTRVQSLSASELLDVWEQCAGAHPVERALSLLSACCSETQEELAILSIGQRDARLLEIYAQMFGPAIDCFAQCPACAEPLEYRLAVDELAQPGANQELPLILETEETRLSLRLLNSRDLQAMRGCSDSTAASMTLLERCVIEASHNGNAIQIQALPESIVEKIASHLVQADPLAETLIDLTCCACRHSWQVILDIESLLWAKINTLAKRLLQEVHALARAYGWREDDILALSAHRRQAYLEMAVSWPTF